MNGNLKKKKVRISLSVSPRTYDALMSLSDASGEPMSKFPSMMLDTSVAQFESMAKAFIAAKKSPDEALAMVRENLELSMINAARVLNDD